MEDKATTPRIIKPRRKDSPAFKEQVLAECQQFGEPIVGVALRHGLNANLIHKWHKARRQDAGNEFLRLPSPRVTAPSISSAPANTADSIHLESAVGQSRVIVDWLKALTA